MKKLFVVLMNLLFVLVVAADVVAVNIGCEATPTVQSNCYIQHQV